MQAGDTDWSTSRRRKEAWAYPFEATSFGGANRAEVEGAQALGLLKHTCIPDQERLLRGSDAVRNSLTRLLPEKLVNETGRPVLRAKQAREAFGTRGSVLRGIKIGAKFREE